MDDIKEFEEKMRHMPQSFQDGLRKQEEIDDNVKARVNFVRVIPAKEKGHEDYCPSAKRQEDMHCCVAHCEVSPHYDGHHTTVWEEYPPPGVVNLECGCPTCEEDQQGAVQGSHVCPDLLKIDEWDTMVDDYWGNAMDVATILDKKC